MMLQFRWIIATRQGWKLALALVSASIWLASFMGLVWTVNGDWRYEQVLGGVVVASGVATMAWLVVSIRCPECRASVFWHFIRRSGAMSWMHDVSSMTACPSCGFDGAPRRSSSSERKSR